MIEIYDIFTTEEMNEYRESLEFIVAEVQGIGTYYQVLLHPDEGQFSVVAKSPVARGHHVWCRRRQTWTGAMTFVMDEVADQLRCEEAGYSV